MTTLGERVTLNKPLHRIFTAVPRRYDLINRIITFGLDQRWRREAAKECLASHPGRVLDIGCGTGDLVLNLARLADDDVALIGLDYSRPMLEIATRKAARLAKKGKITFIYGDAANLPFPDGYFDGVGISFAFRNLTYKNPLTSRHLAEVLRVLSPGGRYVIVESSQPKSKLIRKLYHFYLRWFVYPVGYLLSGNKGAYSYLAESATRFYTAEEVKEMLLAAGFRQVSFRRFFFGAAALHIAVK